MIARRGSTPLLPTNFKMKSTKKKVDPIVLKLWENGEMGEIWQGKEQHFLGNFHDFHPGCMGTKFRLNLPSQKLTDIGNNWHGTYSLAQLLASLTGAKMVVKHMKSEWNG